LDKEGRGIHESCITYDRKEYLSFEDINSDVAPVKSQKNPTNNTTAKSHQEDKKRNNSKDTHHHIGRPGRIRVLVAESNHDLRYLYQTYLDSLGLDMEIAESGQACLNRFFKNTSNTDFDIVIINTHLFDMPGLVIAKEIRKKNPSQRIVITTTILRERLPKEQLDSLGIGHEYILTIPFRFSDMMHFLSK
jgi:CheY-like chemotaxis protein